MPSEHIPPFSGQIIALLRAELSRPAEDGAGVTKGEALIRTMVSEALAGDMRMLSSILKEIGKPEAASLPSAPEQERTHPNEWHAAFAFYGKYKKLIDAEIRKLKKSDADYWSFEWFRPTLKTAPWYKDLYENRD